MVPSIDYKIAFQNIWLTSDTHFGHKNILHLGEGRPFDTIEEHDAALIENWNSVVGKNDIVFHLGDFSMSIADMEGVAPFLNGFTVLVAGNHDACWTRNGTRTGKSVRAAQRYVDAGLSVVGYGQLNATVRGLRLPRLSHLPAQGDHTAMSRYDEFRPVLNRREFLLCGHVHHAWRRHGLQVNVGVDKWNYTPVNYDEVLLTCLRRDDGNDYASEN
jgi:calcineurin-like phosphoesterase family protein